MAKGETLNFSSQIYQKKYTLFEDMFLIYSFLSYIFNHYVLYSKVSVLVEKESYHPKLRSHFLMSSITWQFTQVSSQELHERKLDSLDYFKKRQIFRLNSDSGCSYLDLFIPHNRWFMVATFFKGSEQDKQGNNVHVPIKIMEQLSLI